MPPTEEKKNNKQAMPVLKDYAAATRKYPGLFAILLFGTLGIQAAEIIAPLFLKHFVDLLTLTPVERTITQGLFLTLTAYVAAMFTSWLMNRVMIFSLMKIEARVAVDLTNKAYGYLMHHGHDFFTNNFTGTLTRRVSRYASAYEQVLDSIMTNFIPTFVFAIAVIVILFSRNHLLGIGLLVWTIGFLILQFVMTKWRYHYKILRAAQDSRLTGALSDSIGNHSTVTFFAAEAHEKKRIAIVVKDWFDATMKSWNADAMNYAVQGFLTRTAQAGLLFGALILWQRGLLTVGDFILIQVYMLSLMERITNIGSNMRRVYDSFADANEMIEIFEQPHTIQDKKDAAVLAVSKGEISFESAGFEFVSEKTILDDFNLEIRGGEKIALVGPSGAGKSTITKLLLRLYDVTGGAIRIDGQDIRDISQESLRENISFVPQESVLFHRTLRENIAYAKPDATLEEIIEASKKAHCHEFIDTLPQKYDTFVGERGVKLSGGERQRVAIARAILKNAPILILDEATSALDSESEALIQDALKVLMEGKTVIVIAHRLSTIMTMDRIIVIEGGKIAAEGTHDELVNHTGGLYHKLWSIQAGGFIDDEKPSAA